MGDRRRLGAKPLKRAMPRECSTAAASRCWRLARNPYEIETAARSSSSKMLPQPFRIDRMLMQLKLAGKFKEVQGIIFGEMLDCRQSRPGLHAARSRAARGGRLEMPVAYGLRSGHVSRGNITLPIGVKPAWKSGDVVSLDSRSRQPRNDRQNMRKPRRRQKQTHPPDRHLRHRHGLAGRNVASSAAIA